MVLWLQPLTVRPHELRSGKTIDRQLELILGFKPCRQVGLPCERVEFKAFCDSA